MHTDVPHLPSPPRPRPRLPPRPLAALARAAPPRRLLPATTCPPPLVLRDRIPRPAFCALLFSCHSPLHPLRPPSRSLAGSGLRKRRGPQRGVGRIDFSQGDSPITVCVDRVGSRDGRAHGLRAPAQPPRRGDGQRPIRVRADGPRPCAAWHALAPLSPCTVRRQPGTLAHSGDARGLRPPERAGPRAH